MKHGGGNNGRRRNGQKGHRKVLAIVVAIAAAAGIVAGISLFNKSSDSLGPLPDNLPTTPQSYLGVFANGAPGSYDGVTSFTNATGAKPDIVMYYSGWYVPFKTSFATTAAQNGAVPLVQMDPTGVSVAAVAAGRYDGYLSAYAEAVRAYRHPVIMSFGHEMNGTWYSWGYQKTDPATFVAAWRHVVTLFRALGASNVTWMWTVNVVDDTQRGTIPPPAPWWPGSSYVNWVGIDGYYLKSDWQFAPLFGPTIAKVRELTTDPILIAETGATVSSGQPAKIADAFAGIHSYGLLGFVWFDTTDETGQGFGLSSAASFAAFRKGAASTYTRPAS